jgi:hypothetical protein
LGQAAQAQQNEEQELDLGLRDATRDAGDEQPLLASAR